MQKLQGMIAFLVVLFVMPLGHAVMILMEAVFGRSAIYPAAFVMGLVGVVLVYIGLRTQREMLATWFGFFGGILVWTGWVEFGYVFFARHLGVEPLVVNGDVATKPEYLVMLSSLGLVAATLPYFLFNNQTHCPFFTWFQRNLRMGIARTNDGAPRYIAVITFMETIYVLWVFYVLLLLVYDETLLGDRHPVAYLVFFGSLLWSVYLFIRLMRIQNFSFAVRYSIPTVIIFWNSVEILGRWGFFQEIWIKPLDYLPQMGMILVAFVGALVISRVYGERRVEE